MRQVKQLMAEKGKKKKVWKEFGRFVFLCL